MENKKSPLIPLVLIPIGAIMVFALVYGGYYLIFMLLERFMFHQNGRGPLTPMMLRISYAILLTALAFLVQRSRASDLVKAIVLTAPLTMLIITVLLMFYQTIPVALALILGIAVITLLVLVRLHKPWFYYYAAGLAVAAGFFYGWPR